MGSDWSTEEKLGAGVAGAVLLAVILYFMFKNRSRLKKKGDHEQEDLAVVEEDEAFQNDHLRRNTRSSS